MNNKDRKRQIAYEALMILGLLALLTFICRLWPILLLIILGIFVAAIRLLFLSGNRVDPVEPQPLLPAPIPAPTESDLRKLAQSLITSRITTLVLNEYPNARWIWEAPNAFELIELGEEVYILLNRAGGYRKAKVIICKHAKETTGKSMQMRNFLLRGPAGTGKTMGAKAIAAGLGLPYMKYTCSANTEIFDFVGMIFPDSENSTGSAQLDAERETLMQMGGINYANVSKLMKLPDLDDMDYDPAGVYMALTGVENAAATSQDCMSIVLDRVTEKVRELSKTVKDKNSSGQTYRYVETDFVKALKHGYVIEIQEPSTIVQPGVLVGLNSLLEQSGSITLPTGEVIQRHPDAVVVVTTNTSYEGCRGMNQSVLDRMSLVRDVELPSPEVMAQRAMSVTGATDEYEVSKMVQVVNDLAEYCRKNSITDGSYGMRSLIDWIISSEITGDVYESALYTIISKATADELDREALISTVLEPIFAPKRHKASA